MTTLVSSGEEQSWKAMLQSIFPPDMKIPDEDALEYSFATVYKGPPPTFDVPKAKRIDIAPYFASQRPVLNSSTDVTIPLASTVPAESTAATKVEEAEVGSPSVSVQFASFHLENTQELVCAEQDDHASIRSEFSFGGPQSSSFRTSNSNSGSVDGVSREISERDPKKLSSQPRKKGECHGCLNTNKFQEREACLACSAKFCSSCVLKAMGSMPEGRKCVTCVGQFILESKRSKLGRPSRLLNHLLSPLEVQQIMKAERGCAANQLRPDQVIVNGRPLNAQELAELLGCSNPPSQLKPGDFWYDEQSGYWGKKGEKPDSIITTGLNVGAILEENASAGCTKVYMNGREITKVELRMLKIAKVQCSPKTSLWVHPGGEYRFEGQNNICGNIWGKTSVKFLSPFFSLPTPSCNKNNKNVSDGTRLVPEYLDQRKTYKLLLLGPEGCGTSTIFKQAKLLYKDEKFTHEELQSAKLMIQSNIYKYISTLLEARERFEDEELREKSSGDATSGSQEQPDWQLAVAASGDAQGGKSLYAISDKLKREADWLLEIMASGHLDKYFPAATREYAPTIEEMWKDPAIQATYERRSELHMLPDVAKYFLDRAVEISSNEYEPTSEDVLLVGGVMHGSGVAEMEFSLKEKTPMPAAHHHHDSLDELSSSVRYHLIRINAKGLIEGCKWLEMFEDVHAIIFCVALDEYDQIWTDGCSPPQNKMLLSRDLLENILKHPSFGRIPFVLLLNKHDAFEEKIPKVPLTTCEWFSDFNPVRASHHTAQLLAQQAYTYVAHTFRKHFEGIHPYGQRPYTLELKARERASVKSAFLYVKEVLDWEEKKHSCLTNIPLDSLVDSSEFSSISALMPANGH